MLTHVDVFLGVAMVMLAVSLLLTIVTQAVSLVLELRAGQLRKGLAELFQTLRITDDGTTLADTILRHPLISDGVWKKLAPAISKTDLLHLLQGAGTLLDVHPAIAEKVKSSTAEVDKWFDATMSRVAHRFTSWTRVITVAGAVIAAFLLQLDAFGLVERLYADSDLRARLAGAAATMVSEGQEVLATPALFTDAAKKVAAASGGKLPAPAQSFRSRADAEAWIRDAAKPEDQPQLVASYGAALQAELAPALQQWLGKAGEIKDRLDAASFRLVPEPYRPFQYRSFWSFLGVIASAALLSLGAPFWFNALKTASNLRPALAAAVDARDDGTSDKPAQDGAGK